MLLLVSSRAGLQSPSYLLTRDGRYDEVLAHHFGYKLRNTRNRRKMAGGDGVEESRNDDLRARGRNASAPLRRSAVGSAPVSRGTAATLFRLRPLYARLLDQLHDTLHSGSIPEMTLDSYLHHAQKSIHCSYRLCAIGFVIFAKAFIVVAPGTIV